MTRRAWFLLVWALSSGGGCHRSPEALLTESRTGEASSSAGPHPLPLLPADLDGVLPPRWGVGDTWIVRTSTIEHDDSGGESRRTHHQRFQVRDVPREGADYYVVTTHGRDRHGDSRTILAFRVPDLAATEAYSSDWPPTKIDPSFSRAALPDVRGGPPVFAFPIMPPLLDEVPPRFANPMSFPREDAEPIRQTIEPTADGLHIHFENPAMFDDAVKVIDLTWRRGDPWWSSVRVRIKGGFGSDTMGDDFLFAFADLYRPGEPLDPIPRWWPVGAEMPDASDAPLPE
jgi:hypothetical protein